MYDNSDTPNKQPLPIPRGVISSQQVCSLGNGIHILLHCYDRVAYDGTVQLKLEQVAEMVGAEYPTVKRWWGKLRDSGILKDIAYHGCNGISARFDTHWLDWHILAQRGAPLYPTEETHGIAVAAKTTLVAQETGQNRDGIGSRIAPDPANGSPSGRQQDANGSKHDPVPVKGPQLEHEQDEIGTESGSHMIPNFPIYMVLGEDEESRSLSSSSPPVPNPPAHAHEADILGPLGRAVMNMPGTKSAKAALAVQKSCLQAGTDLPTLQASIAVLQNAGWTVGRIIERLKYDPPAPGQPYAVPAEDPAYDPRHAYGNAYQHNQPGARTASARKNERSRRELERITAASSRSPY